MKRETGSISAEKPHVVLVPYPAQGHVTPVLKLGKLLHTYGFHITFVNTEFNHNRLLNSRGPSALDGLPDFRFETIPDGLPPSDENKTQDIPPLCDSIVKNCLAPFRNLLLKLNDPSSNVPPVTCVVTDAVMSFAMDAAKELGIPDVLFWTPSACGVMSYLHYHEFVARGLIPLKDESDITNGFLDTTIDWIPGMKNIRLKDIPSFIRTTDREDIMLNFYIRERGRTSMASAIILNTFDDLEGPVLDAMEKMQLPPIYTIGPICLLSRHIPSNSPLASIESSLWKEETSCLEWLEGKDPGSVVLVNFGSITTMTSNQLVEFAWGLANSNANFLWVVRPDLVKGESAVLPEEFLSTATGGRGLLASWCNQETVLTHRAVGGFLTHCGWNSTLESISGGVPTLCWPFFAEQQTNCRYLCTEWGMGMEIDNDVKRREVEEIIRELMGGEKGKEMRKRALEWKERAYNAAKHGGSSFVNLDRLVKEVLLLPKKSK